MGNNLIAEIAKEFISGNTEDVVDVITFVEAPWGLNVKLLPVQKFILKCVSGDSIISDDNGIPVTMRDYYESNNRFVSTYDDADGRIKRVAHNGCIRNGTKEVFCLRTKLTKRTVGVTSDHGILTPDGYVPVEKLKKGDWVVISEKEPRPLGVSGITIDEAAILGFMVGDGSCSHTNIGLVVCNGDWDVHREFERACLSIMPDATFRVDKRKGAYVVFVSRSDGWDRNTKSVIGNLLCRHGLMGKTCHEKRIPKDVFYANDIVIRHFLKCLFATDGGMSYSDKGTTNVVSINYTSCNKVLIDDVRFLLRRFGIRSTVVDHPAEQVKRYKGAFSGTTDSWQVKINSVQEMERFFDRVGIPFGWSTRYRNVWDVVRVRSGGSFCHADRLPSSLCKRAEGGRGTFLANGGKIRRTSPGSVRAQITGKKALRMFAEFVDDNDLRRLANSDVCWDRIESIEACGEKDVYDISVPVTHNFVFDGIVVHNCFYGMPLGRGEKNISIPDITNEHILYTFNEVEFLKWLHAEGRCNTDVTEGIVFQEIVLAIGRRGTKSSISSFISNYELYKLVKRGDPARYYGLTPYAQIAVLNVAPTDDQSGIVFDMTQNMAMRCPYMKERSLHQTMTYFDIQTDADMKQYGKPKASLMSVAGGCSSNSLRGRNAIVVVMDEMAHFIDNNGRFSGSEVYKALTPSIATFRRDGKVISISSPYAKYGMFYDRYIQSSHEKDFTLMFKMYSAMVNPTIPSEILRAARRRDRTGFMCEYGGEFSDSVMAWIEDEAEFKKCVVSMAIPTHGQYDVPYYYGIDLGFKNDGTAVAVVHKDNATNKIVLDYANVWYSGSSDVWEFDDSLYRSCNKYASLDLLRMGDIIAEVQKTNQLFPSKDGVFDQHNGYALAELFELNKMKQFHMENFSDSTNSDIYQLVKRLYAEEMLVIFHHPILVPEMISLEAEKRSKDKTIVRKPNRRGAHDDILDAFARAVWLCYNGHKAHPMNVAVGSGGRVMTAMMSRHAERQDSAAAFTLRKLKTHGDHPRGLYSMKARRIAGVMTGGRE